jgi:hypothetical protein
MRWRGYAATCATLGSANGRIADRMPSTVLNGVDYFDCRDRDRGGRGSLATTGGAGNGALGPPPPNKRIKLQKIVSNCRPRLEIYALRQQILTTLKYGETTRGH